MKKIFENVDKKGLVIRILITSALEAVIIKLIKPEATFLFSLMVFLVCGYFVFATFYFFNKLRKKEQK
jgi:hypothetical protein